MAKMTLERVVSLHGAVEVEGKVVLQLTANVSSNKGNSSHYSEQVSDTELYYSNRAEVREQVTAFRQKMYETEDLLIKEEVIEQV